MVTLTVTVGREIQFISSSELPAGFRRAIAADNTLTNPLHEKKPKLPATLEVFYHNPITKEVALPRDYWPRFVARAEEYGVKLDVRDMREEYPAVIRRQAAVALPDIAWGMEYLATVLAGAVHTDWGVVNIQVIVTKHRPLELPPPPPPIVVEQPPAPWDKEQKPHG